MISTIFSHPQYFDKLNFKTNYKIFKTNSTIQLILKFYYKFSWRSNNQIMRGKYNLGNGCSHIFFYSLQILKGKHSLTVSFFFISCTKEMNYNKHIKSNLPILYIFILIDLFKKKRDNILV